MISACPTLPSVRAAEAVWKGEPGAAWKVAGSMLERAAIIAVALAAVGERKHLVRNTIAATVGIELVVLAVVERQVR